MLSNEQREVLIQEARMIAARAYDVCLGYMPDGSPMQTVPYRAIMQGHYDNGSIVQQPFADLIAKLDQVDRQPPTEGDRQ